MKNSISTHRWPLAWWVLQTPSSLCKGFVEKDLRNNKLIYEQIQTVLFQMKMVINNIALTNLYPDIPKTPLTLNHLFHAVCETILALMSSPSLIKS